MSVNKLRFGATNSLDVNLVGSTIGSVLTNSNYKSVLGFGSNVQAKVHGSPVNSDYVIRSGDVIDIENRAQQKANGDATVTIAFGATAKLTRSYPHGTTVRSVLADRNVRSALGFGDGAVAKINGTRVSDDLYVTNGMQIDIETSAQQKAAA